MRDYDIDSFMGGFMRLILVGTAVGVWVVVPTVVGLMVIHDVGDEYSTAMVAGLTAATSLPIALVVNLICFGIWKLAFKRPVEPRRGFDVQAISPADTSRRPVGSSRR